MPLTQVPQVMQEFLLVGGISDKSLFGFNSAIIVSSSWISMRTDPLPKLLSKHDWLSFSSDRVKMTKRKTGQSSKTTTMTSHIAWQEWALSSLHMHMIWIIEHNCVEVKACGQNTRLEFCCHHSADATQTGKCCDPLKHLIILHSTEEFKRGI